MLAYAATIFTGAFLLFQVQPLIGKYILPWFGGGPGVWTTCMLFFQVLLLGGYAYAHFTSRWLKPRAQALLHLALLVTALALLPITPSDSWKPADASNPVLRILTLLAVSIGLPYFVLSATGPLVQQWFSRSRPGASPYRLYALSNVGSLLALLSYPFYFETQFTRHTQATLWACGLGLYAVVCGWCAVKLWKAEGESQKAESRKQKAEMGEEKEESRKQKVETGDRVSRFTFHASRFTLHAPRSTLHASPALKPQPSTLNYLLWLLLPACASVLLLATTNKICQDVAVIPFLWVLPLALYLLSFIICFDSPRWYTRWVFGPALALALGAMAWALFRANQSSTFLQIAIYAGGLFICCMACHGELYRLKPDPRQLTGYYLMIAAGGALGGVFVAAIAPLIFGDYFEVHWGILLCGVLFLVVCIKSLRRSGGTNEASARPSPLRPRPSRFIRLCWIGCALWAAGMVALGAALWIQAHKFGGDRLSRARNFYGILTVFKHDTAESHFLELMHGRIQHGLQFLDPVRAQWPTAYFSEQSGVGVAMNALPAPNRRIGVIGLGAGTLAAYCRPGDTLRFYEINPEVLRLAKSPFLYLANCKGEVDVVLGDARLSLEKEPPQNFDLLVLDAFSSDAIPVHLLTEQAFALYERHIKTNGLLAFHISNAHLDLRPIIANLAERFGYASVLIENLPPSDQWWNQLSSWVLLSRNQELINLPSLRERAGTMPVSTGEIPLWTDDFASLFQIIYWRATPRIEIRPAEAEVQLAAECASKRDFSGAMAHYQRALELEPDFVEALNNLAWLLATCPIAAHRNGAEAVRLGEKACALTEHHRTIMVGTLAAAYAEAGRFADATATAQKACNLAMLFKEDSLLAKNREMLELYRAGKPYHEPEPTESLKR